jgi:hypothetical protein
VIGWGQVGTRPFRYGIVGEDDRGSSALVPAEGAERLIITSQTLVGSVSDTL